LERQQFEVESQPRDVVGFPTVVPSVAIEQQLEKTLTLKRYSTALSGLLKLALNALTTSSLGNPISIILVIDASKALPVTKLGSAGVPVVAGGSVTGAAGACSVVSVSIGAAAPVVAGVAEVEAGVWLDVAAGGATGADDADAEVDAADVAGAAFAYAKSDIHECRSCWSDVPLRS